MGSFKTITDSDISTTTSTLNQLVDVIQEDVSGSSTRKKYQVFVTGTTRDSGVTSSLYNTVFDQNFSLQTANELFDLTVGLFSGVLAIYLTRNILFSILTGIIVFIILNKFWLVGFITCQNFVRITYSYFR